MSAATASVTIDAHVVGRIGEDHLREFRAEKRVVGLRKGGISTDYPMRAEQPDVVEAGNEWSPLVYFRQGVSGILLTRGGVGSFRDAVNVGCVESCNFDRKIEIWNR